MLRPVLEVQDLWQLVMLDQWSAGRSQLQEIGTPTINLDEYIEDVEADRKDLGAESLLGVYGVSDTRQHSPSYKLRWRSRCTLFKQSAILDDCLALPEYFCWLAA